MGCLGSSSGALKAPSGLLGGVLWHSQGSGVDLRGFWGGQKLANTAPAHQNKPPDHTAPDPPDASHSAAESPETVLDCISGPP